LCILTKLISFSPESIFADEETDIAEKQMTLIFPWGIGGTTKAGLYELAFLQFCFENLEVVFQLVSISGIV
jgi:hypothetical protein